MASEAKLKLDQLTGEDAKLLYADRGFRGRLGFGARPALVVIDMANAWTREGYPFSCDGMDTMMPATQRVVSACRGKHVPIVFITTAYEVTDGPVTDMGLKHLKIPALRTLKIGSEAVAIDERIAPQVGEFVIVKKQTSAFHGTNLSGLLKGAGVDTIIVTGVTAAGCVRNTVEDAIAEGFRPIVVRECVGDRLPGAVEMNLFDIDTKFGDVESLETVLAYLERMEEME